VLEHALLGHCNSKNKLREKKKWRYNLRIKYIYNGSSEREKEREGKRGPVQYDIAFVIKVVDDYLHPHCSSEHTHDARFDLESAWLGVSRIVHYLPIQS
jgi:hypothetical protein